MKLQDFKVAWRLLVKEPSYSLIVIAGLAIGMALCFLLFGLVRHQYSFDDEIPDSEQIYYANEFWRSLGDSGKTEGVSLPAMQAVVQSGLPVQATMIRSRQADVRVDDHLSTLNLSLVSADFQSIFSVKALNGDLDAATTRPDALALTKDSAIKLFGSDNVIGKAVQIRGVPYTVRAIIPTPPANSSMTYQAIAGFNSQFLPEEERQYLMRGWGTWVGHVYFKTANPATVPLIQETMDRAFKATKYYAKVIVPELSSDHPGGVEFRIGKLRERNLDPNVTSLPLQNPGVLATVTAVGSVVLLLAMANYLNLATVRAIRRQREIAIRKVLGASSHRLLQQFCSESVLVCLLAYALGVLLAWLLLPAFSNLVGLKFPRMFDSYALALSLVVAIVLGLICAMYPAWIALRVLPSAAFAGRGNAENKTGLRLRRLLSVLQFAAAMGLTATGLSYAWQGDFLSHLHPGFESRNLLIVRPPENAQSANGHAFQDAVRRINDTEKMAMSWSPIRDVDGLDELQVVESTPDYPSGSSAKSAQPATLYRMGVSPDFFQTYTMPPIAGRVFESTIDLPEASNKLILNQSAVRKMGFPNEQAAIGKFAKLFGKERQIVGVVADVKQLDPHKPAQATVYFPDDAGAVMAIKAKTSSAQLQKEVDKLWKQYFPDAVLNMTTLESEFALFQYAETKLSQFLNLTSAISIVIAAFGIYVLAAYSVQRRTREIVMRKLYGARKWAIAKLVGREFLTLISIAGCIGLPFAYIKIQHYLANFQDQAPIGLWTIIIAALLGNLVALVSTARHAIVAMNLAPVDALRSE